MIAGDHQRTNAGAPCACDRLLGFRTRGINHADQSKEDEVLFDTLIRMRGVCREGFAGKPSSGDGKRAQRLTR